MEVVRKRTGAVKPVARAGVKLSGKDSNAYVDAVARLAAESHVKRGGLTLVIVNRVARAQAIYRALRVRRVEPLALIHSRFRGVDRCRHQELLTAAGDRVVVATQAVEAGVDISARTLVTELAPWPSLVQRLGRCNRYGEDNSSSQVLWLDLDVEGDGELARPYDATELMRARSLLDGLADANPDCLAAVPYSPPRAIRPVLRSRDLLDLFDTTPDLLGNDVDVSRFVRDGDDTDVLVYWRSFDGTPDPATTMPGRDEIVRVPIGEARAFLARLDAKRRALGDSSRDRERRTWLTAWVPNPLATQMPWTRAAAVHPGQVILLHTAAGGYDRELGWTGEVLPAEPVDTVGPGETPAASERLDSDRRSGAGRWIPLARHLASVTQDARGLANALGLPRHLVEAVESAATWHDVGKAHPEFQRRLVEPVAEDPLLAPPGDGPWAKAPHDRRPPREVRPYFRHELASALAWLQLGPRGPQHDLVAYLIAAHHGKVRLSIRSVPGERRPPESGRLFARGVWHGDLLPAVALPDELVIGPLELDLSPMQLGEGSWLERTLALRDDPALGPFRLAFLESVVRIGDWRASEREDRDA
jgi:CRISPR-associated endonuclease/helicase Cas3